MLMTDDNKDYFLPGKMKRFRQRLLMIHSRGCDYNCINVKGNCNMHVNMNKNNKCL